MGRLCSLIGGVRLLSGGSQVPLPSQGVQIPLSTDGQGGLPNYQIKPSKHDVTPSILEGTLLDPGLQSLYLCTHSRTRDGCFQSFWDEGIWGSLILSGSSNSTESGDTKGPASQRSGCDGLGGSRGASWHPIRVYIQQYRWQCLGNRAFPPPTTGPSWWCQILGNAGSQLSELIPNMTLFPCWVLLSKLWAASQALGTMHSKTSPNYNRIHRQKFQYW